MFFWGGGTTGVHPIAYALAISERTYRTQVAELHLVVTEQLEKRLQAADSAAWRVLVGGVPCVHLPHRRCLPYLHERLGGTVREAQATPLVSFHLA